MNGEWRDLVVESVMRPREAARGVMELGVPQNVVLMAAVAVTCAGLVLGWVGMMLTPGASAIDGVSAAILGNPLLSAGAEFVGMLIVAGLTARVGRAFGGTGGFWDALTLIVWLNALLLLIQIVQIVLLAVAPPIAGIIALAALFWAVWAFASFVAELHGFLNPLKVLGGVILTAIVLFFMLSILLAMSGLMPQGAV